MRLSGKLNFKVSVRKSKYQQISKLNTSGILPCIVVVAYERVEGLNRLFDSLLAADIPEQVQLVISIDGGGPEEVLKLAQSIEWPFGEKRVIRHTEHLGLRKHILSCGKLTGEFDRIILLEDDLFVSPQFYAYTLQSLEFIGEDEQVAGISLYDYQLAESCYKLFETLEDGYDNYYMQVPASWGQCWTKAQFDLFVNWLESDGKLKDSLPRYVRDWRHNSWKSLFFQYLIDSGRYFFYPTSSLSTNFAMAGTNFPVGMNLYQSPLLSKAAEFRFCRLADSANRYDAYFEMEARCYRDHWSDREELIALDLYGQKTPAHIAEERVFSSQECSGASEKYDNRLRPLINNLILQAAGQELCLVKREQLSDNSAQTDLVNADMLYSAFVLPLRKMNFLLSTWRNWRVRIKLMLRKRNGR